MTSPQNPQTASASSPTPIIATSRTKKTGKKITLFQSIFLIAVLLLGWGLMGTWMIIVLEVPFYLLLGWLVYLVKGLLPLLLDFKSLVSIVFCLTGIILGTHFCLRCYAAYFRKVSADVSMRPKWRWSWTLGGATMVMVLFVIGFVANGIVQQLTWPKGERWIKSGRSLIDSRPSIIRNLRQQLYHIVVDSEDSRSLPLAQTWTPLKEVKFQKPVNFSTNDMLGRPVMYLSDGKNCFLRSYGLDGVPDSESDVTDDVFIYANGKEIEKTLSEP